MSDAIIMAACAVAAVVLVWYVQGLLTEISAGMVAVFPIG